MRSDVFACPLPIFILNEYFNKSIKCPANLTRRICLLIFNLLKFLMHAYLC